MDRVGSYRLGRLRLTNVRGLARGDYHMVNQIGAGLAHTLDHGGGLQEHRPELTVEV